MDLSVCKLDDPVCLLCYFHVVSHENQGDTIPAEESISVEVVMPKDASIDYVGNDKGKDGFDMATKLGSNLTFTEQTASICRFEEIEIIAQNFGFDLENGITNVPLDLNQDHYWIQVRKVHK